MEPSSIDQLKITAPCPKVWESLQGGDAKRFCDACELHVHNVAELPRNDAEELLEKRSEARLCLRILRDADGRVLTREDFDAHAEAPATAAPTEGRRKSLWARAAAWLLLGGSSLLSACFGGNSQDSFGGSSQDTRSQTETPAQDLTENHQDPLEQLGGLAEMGYVDDGESTESLSQEDLQHLEELGYAE